MSFRRGGATVAPPLDPPRRYAENEFGSRRSRVLVTGAPVAAPAGGYFFARSSVFSSSLALGVTELSGCSFTSIQSTLRPSVFLPHAT